jgi:predicted RNA-binding protein
LFISSVLIPVEREEDMCEANAYLVKDGEEKIIMENVDILRPEENGIYLQDIFGGQRTIKARIKEMNLVEHRILLEEE